MKTQNKQEIKNENKRTRKIYKKENGGGIFDIFRSKPKNAAMNYPLKYISYNDKKIQCDVCQENIFMIINASIDRSKTATIIFGNDLGDFVSHPVKMYVCNNCSNCKFVYTATDYNGITTRIIETDATASNSEKETPKAPMAPEQPKAPMAQPAQPLQN